MNSVRKSRGAWRIAAFVDAVGLACYQNCTAIWPQDPLNIVVVAAILNGPIANAYLASREGNVHLTVADIERIPVPEITDELRRRVESLVVDYWFWVSQREEWAFGAEGYPQAADALKRIDAAVLDAYGLPPRLERETLDYFNGEQRKVPYPFGDFFPHEFESAFSLSEYLSPEFAEGTARHFLKRYDLPPHRPDSAG